MLPYWGRAKEVQRPASLQKRIFLSPLKLAEYHTPDCQMASPAGLRRMQFVSVRRRYFLIGVELKKCNVQQGCKAARGVYLTLCKQHSIYQDIQLILADEVLLK